MDIKKVPRFTFGFCAECAPIWINVSGIWLIMTPSSAKTRWHSFLPSGARLYREIGILGKKIGLQNSAKVKFSRFFDPQMKIIGYCSKGFCLFVKTSSKNFHLRVVSFFNIQKTAIFASFFKLWSVKKLKHKKIRTGKDLV